MSRFAAELPRLANGEPDVDLWLDDACGVASDSREMARTVLALVAADESRRLGLALLELLWQLKMDVVTVMAGMSLFAVQRGDIRVDALPREVAELVGAVLRLDAVDVLAFDDSAVLSAQSRSQAENVRHLLIALIDDPRVAVAKLAERVVALRDAGQRGKAFDRAARHVMAREAVEFFAPLAGRLGIWQLKWSLEDLAFSHLYPKQYKEVVANLDSRREARERQVEAIRQDLEFRLSNAGIEGEVQGRAKHLYSIWRKMSHKAIAFSEVRDVQAVRVLVANVNDCYRVLGVVHTSWPSIPGEFDDYIANPKENGYRSIHTTVFGPAGKELEVQIRTWEMHEEAELGVCAHWAYKDDSNGAVQDESMGSQKMDWLRSVLEWYEQRFDRRDANIRLGPTAGNVFASEPRIYVTTPQGHVLDMAATATPVDFAYRVHTEIGHRCRGARVNGRPVPLNRRLATGECVEIETAAEAAPPREWLNPALGYVNTPRARAKVQSWFRDQLAESNVHAGRALLEESLARLDFPNDDSSALRFQALAERAGYATEEEMLLAIGVGDALVIDLVRLLAENGGDDPPLEPDAGTGVFVGLVVHGRDRDGLLRDVMSSVAAASIPVVAANARADVPGESATITLELHMADGPDSDFFVRVLEDIGRVEGVVDVSWSQAENLRPEAV